MPSRIVEASAHAVVKATAEISCTIARAATGRSVSFVTPEEQRIDALAAAWFSQSCEDTFRVHDAAHEFAEAARSAPTATGRITCFRGRLFTIATVTDSYAFGPPPREVAGHGRYNPKGQAMLYLASTVCGVAAELARHRREGMQLFCQRFSVDLDALKVADLRATENIPIFQICFDYSERERDSARYFKSQILAESIAMAGFNGFLVPGVRGTKENRYHNLVIFEPEAQWRGWVVVTSPPDLVAM